MAGTRADEAMERYARGDDGAFATLFEELAPRLKALATRELGDAALAEDVVQQTFLNVHRARGMFVAGAEVLPWAYAIARRLAMDELRRRARAKRIVGSERPAPGDGGARPDEEVAAQQTASRLERAFAALPESQQRVFRLRRHGLSIAEVAGMLGTTIPSVKLRLHRAAVALRASLVASACEPGT